MTSVAAFLRSIPAHLHVLPRNLVSVRADQKTLEAFALLCTHRISSAPVVDADDRFVGFLEIRDLLAYLVFQMDEKEATTIERSPSRSPPAHTRSLSPTPEARTALAHAPNQSFLQCAMFGAAKMHEAPIDGVSVSYLAHRHAASHVAGRGATLLDAAQLLAAGAHRVAVLDSDARVLTVISQSAVIRLLNSMTSAAAVAELRVRLCDTNDLVSKPVFCVRDCARTIDVLRELTQRTLSSVPLLDERGEWVATFSISDLKVFVHHLRIEHLELPIVTLLGMVRQQNDKHARCQTMAVPWSATLGEVIAKLAATQVHRMFVRDVDSTGAPTGCVSLTDLLEHLVVPELVSSKA